MSSKLEARKYLAKYPCKIRLFLPTTRSWALLTPLGVSVGGGRRIRTSDTLRYACFQNKCVRPLRHPTLGGQNTLFSLPWRQRFIGRHSMKLDGLVHATVCFPLNDRGEALIGRKTRIIGIGLYNGPGGGIEKKREYRQGHRARGTRGNRNKNRPS